MESNDQSTPSPYEQAYGAQSQPLPGPCSPEYSTTSAQPASPAQGFSQPFSDGVSVPQPPVQQPAYVTPSAPAAAVAPKGGKGWIVGIVIVLAIMIVMIVSVVSCSSTMSTVMNPFSSISSSNGTVAATSPSVAVIDIDGTIQYDGTSCSPEGLKDLLDEAADDSNIVSVVLRVNSGGGVATAGEEMAAYVRDFEKPIVVSSAATNASAAYEISSQADRIFVDQTTMIGSIGVIMQVTDLSGLYDKLGISIDSITSADAKDAGSGSRPLTEEERAWYQDMVDQINDTFVQTVADGRDMDIEDVRELANGLPFTGIDAVDNGLADELGLMEDAVLYASEEAGYDHALPVVSLYDRSSDLMSLLDILGKSDSEMGNAAKLQALIDRLEQAGALE